MTRTFALLAFALFVAFSASASAATLGDVYKLTADTEAAQKARCPAEAPRKAGDLPDMKRFTCVMKAYGIKSGLTNIAMQFTKKLMSDCEKLTMEQLKNKAPVRPEVDCQVTNAKYESAVLPTGYDAAYKKVKELYDSFLAEYPRR